MEIMNSRLLMLFFLLCFSSVSAHRWEEFSGLAGCRMGDTNPVIPELKKYLHHFGYLPNEHHHPSKLTDSFDEALHTALRTYQLNFNLEATGVLDPPTIGLLTTPRCGVPDIINGTASMRSGKLFGGRLHYAFFPGRPKWPPARRILKYHVDYKTYKTNTKGNSTREAIQKVIYSAFRRWAQVTKFIFIEAGSLPADIRIGFYRLNHGDNISFDGPGGLLAHASKPPDGTFHLDGDEDWHVNETKVTWTSYDLESVCVHEIGHLLGLAHSSVRDAIMYPHLPPVRVKKDLRKDDIDGIKALYGFPLSAMERGGGDPKLHVAY